MSRGMLRLLCNYLAELFGDGASEVITKGLPRALGMDLSSRVGLDSLIYRVCKKV